MTSIAELEEALSRPSEADIEFLRRHEGDILILGAGGKIGPSLASLCRRASDAAGAPRRVIAVSRRECDLLDRSAVARLPRSPNVLHLAGRKFGSTGSPELTWAANVIIPSIVAEHFRESRVVVFSTGNVYALRDPAAGGEPSPDQRCQCDDGNAGCGKADQQRCRLHQEREPDHGLPRHHPLTADRIIERIVTPASRRLMTADPTMIWPRGSVISGWR